MKKLNIIFIIVLSCLLCSCSPPIINGFCGRVPVLDIKEKTSKFDTPTNISFFNGEEIIDLKIIVHRPLDYIESEELIEKMNADTSKIKTDEISSFYCFSIEGNNENIPIPMLITDYNKKGLTYNGINYSQNVYHLASNIYCFRLPNGCKQCVLKVGNTYFQ